MTERTTAMLLPLMATQPRQPEVIYNDAAGIADAAMGGEVTIDVAADSDITIGTTGVPAEWQYAVIVITDIGSEPVLTGPVDVIWPDKARRGPFTFVNETAEILTVKRTGQTGVAVAPGTSVFMRDDGADIVAQDLGAVDAGDVTYTPAALSSDWPGSEEPSTVEQGLDFLANRVAELEQGGGGSGDVVGPASATDGSLAAFDGATGKLIKQLTPAQAAALLQGDGLTADLAGFRGIPQNSQSSAYTLVAADAGKHIYHPAADTTARTWTIPANGSVAFPIGTAITFDNDFGAGAITIGITTDTLVLVGLAGSTGTRTLASGGQATAVKVAATRWRISGVGLS